MNSKFKYTVTTIGLFIILVTMFILNYRQNKILTDSEINLYKIYAEEKNNKYEVKKYSYSDMINQIQINSCIKIKKIINNNHDKVFNMNLEFEGEKEKLDEFIEYIKSQKNLYEIKGIQVSSKDSKIYSGNIILNFGL